VRGVPPVAAARRARSLRKTRERDARTASRLEGIRLLSDRKPRWAEEAYEPAFAAYGVEPLEAGPEPVAESAIAGSLVAALDDWLGLRLAADGADDPTTRWISGLLRAADPDPGRCRVRELAAAGDRDALETLAAAADPDPATARLLADRLSALGGHAAAAGLLRRVLRSHPGNPDLAWSMARTLSRLDRWADAAGWFRAAWTLRPAHAEIGRRLGTALRRTGRTDEALRAWRNVLRAEPDDVRSHRRIFHAVFAQPLVERSRRVRAWLEEELRRRPERSSGSGPGRSPKTCPRRRRRRGGSSRAGPPRSGGS